MAHHNSGIGCLLGLIALAIFMLFYNRLGYFFYPVSPILITIIAGFVFLVVGISVISSKFSHKGTNPNYLKNPVNNYNSYLKNPYIIKNNRQQIPIDSEQKVESLTKDTTIAQYCQFCGVKRERDSIFCPNCGTRL